MFGLTKLINKELYGYFVAKLYMSNNYLRPTVPATASKQHYKYLVCLDLYTHITVALTLVICPTAANLCVDTTVEILLSARCLKTM